MLDPTSVSEAHQMALQLEKQMSRRSGNISRVQFGTTRGTSHVTQNNDTNQQTTSSKTTMKPQASHSTSSSTSGAATRCFKCGEKGHRMADCKKGGRYGKDLFIENEELPSDEHNNFKEGPIFDAHDDDLAEEHVYGDVGPLLVVRRACLTPRVVEGDS